MAAPSFEEYLADARKFNSNDSLTDEQIGQRWQADFAAPIGADVGWGETLTRGLRNTESNLAGADLQAGTLSPQDYASTVAENQQLNAVIPESQDKLDFLNEFKHAKGGVETLKSIGSNPFGVARFVVEQAANSLPSIGMGAVGAIAAAPTGIGALVGFGAGMSVGTVAIETGAEIIDALGKAGVDITSKQSIEEALTPEFLSTALDRGLIRGSVIAAVDIATLKLDAVFMGAGGRALKSTLLREGIDVADDKAVKAALKSENKAVQGAFDSYAKTRTLKGRVKSGLFPFAMETGGEMAGEAGAQLAVGDELDKGEIILEGVGGFGMSVATVTATGLLEGKKATLQAAKKRRDTRLQVTADRVRAEGGDDLDVATAQGQDYEMGSDTEVAQAAADLTSHEESIVTAQEQDQADDDVAAGLDSGVYSAALEIEDIYDGHGEAVLDEIIKGKLDIHAAHALIAERKAQLDADKTLNPEQNKPLSDAENPLTQDVFTPTHEMPNGEAVTAVENDEGLNLYENEAGEQYEEDNATEIKNAVDIAGEEAAHSVDNDLPEPTDAQKEAGNYKMGKVKVQGLDISIENPKGSTRTGVSPDGDKWSTELNTHYGYIKRTIGNDTDQVDVFLGKNAETATKVFVVDQVDPKTGEFDEHKVVMGHETEEAALEEYNSNYDQDWEGAGEVTEMTVDEFKTWVKDGVKDKPANDDQTVIGADKKERRAEPDDTVDREQRKPEKAGLRKALDDFGKVITDEEGKEQQPDHELIELSKEELVDKLRQAGNEADNLLKRLYTSFTGLPNQNAYLDAPKLKYTASLDVDSLGWINDNVNHTAGDELLKVVADALIKANVKAFHKSGDEFTAQHDSLVILNKQLEHAMDILKGVKIQGTNAEGETHTINGVSFSYGTGTTYEEADNNLHPAKARREAEGTRAAKGTKPKGTVTTTERETGDSESDQAEGTAKVTPLQQSALDEIDYHAERIDEETQQPYGQTIGLELALEANEDNKAIRMSLRRIAIERGEVFREISDEEIANTTYSDPKDKGFDFQYQNKKWTYVLGSDEVVPEKSTEAEHTSRIVGMGFNSIDDFVFENVDSDQLKTGVTYKYNGIISNSERLSFVEIDDATGERINGAFFVSPDILDQSDLVYTVAGERFPKAPQAEKVEVPTAPKPAGIKESVPPSDETLESFIGDRPMGAMYLYPMTGYTTSVDSLNPDDPMGIKKWRTTALKKYADDIKHAAKFYGLPSSGTKLSLVNAVEKKNKYEWELSHFNEGVNFRGFDQVKAMSLLSDAGVDAEGIDNQSLSIMVQNLNWLWRTEHNTRSAKAEYVKKNQGKNLTDEAAESYDKARKEIYGTSKWRKFTLSDLLGEEYRTETQDQLKRLGRSKAKEAVTIRKDAEMMLESSAVSFSNPIVTKTRIDEFLKGKPEQKQTVIKKTDKPEAQKPTGDMLLGVNGDGNQVYVDDNGVRYYVDGGVKVSETVALRPTRGGIEQSLADTRKPEHKTTDELETEKKPLSDIMMQDEDGNSYSAADLVAATDARLDALNKLKDCLT